jgi:hypothetical protein
MCGAARGGGGGPLNESRFLSARSAQNGREPLVDDGYLGARAKHVIHYLTW